MKISKILAVAELAVVLALFGQAASAAPPPNGPCADDIKKFCADVKPGAGGVAACLKQHEADLSAACKTHQEQVRATAQAKVDEFSTACGEDAKKLCADVKPGKARVMKCLHGKEAELSPNCKQIMEKQDARKPKGHGPGPIVK